MLPRTRADLLATVICLGFNHHHKTAPKTWDNPPHEPQSIDADEPFDTGDYNPEGKRVWSWLILCDDGNPPPHLTATCYDGSSLAAARLLFSAACPPPPFPKYINSLVLLRASLPAPPPTLAPLQER